MNFFKTLRRLGLAGLALCFAAMLLLHAAPALAAPAAGTVIGNQASATYVDGAGSSRNTTSNLVQTTVSQVKSFSLSANGARAGAAGQTVYYPHVITNLGNGTDTYTLTAPAAGGTITQTGLAYYVDANGDGVPDNSTPITSTGPLAAGGQFRFVVAAVIPAAATSGQTGTVTVAATDTGTNSGSNTDTTTVSNAAISVTKSLSSTSGPSSGTLVVTLAYTNSGTAAASNVTLGDLLPTGMTYVPNSARWSVSGATALADTGTGNPAGIAYDYGVTTAGKVTASITNVSAGSSGQLTFSVTVNGGLSPTNTALGSSCTTAGCPALTTNTATYGATGQPSANTNSVLYTVVQSASVVINGSSSSNVAGTGSPVTVATASQGSTVSFTTYVWNTGNGSDSFNITSSGSTFPAGTTFQYYKADGTTPLLDTNGDGTVDTGPMAAGSSYAVVVKASLPTSGTTGNNGGAGYVDSITATSAFTTSVTSSATIKVSTITANTVDLTADYYIGGTPNATAANGLGPTGSTVVSTQTVIPSQNTTSTAVFKVYVNNTGAGVDSYNLSLQAALPTGWSLQFVADGGSGNCTTLGSPLTNTGSVPGAGKSLVCAVVTVPSIQTGALPGSTPFVVVAQSASTAASNDTVGLQVTVTTVHAVTLSPNGQQQTYASSSVTYTHVLTNIGNVSETVTFNAGFLTDSQTAAGWTSTAYIDTNGNGGLDVGTDTLLANGSTITLPVGSSKTLFVHVFAPASVTSASPADVSTLTGSYTGSTASATDTTGITDGLLLVKQQVLVSCSDLTNPHTGYSTNPIAAGAGTAPGQCISYLITATNTTAAKVTNVQMADTIPANTTRNDGCGAPTGSAGVTMGGTATNGNIGTVTATIASLNPSASMTASFCVKINP